MIIFERLCVMANSYFTKVILLNVKLIIFHIESSMFTYNLIVLWLVWKKKEDLKKQQQATASFNLIFFLNVEISLYVCLVNMDIWEKNM